MKINSPGKLMRVEVIVGLVVGIDDLVAIEKEPKYDGRYTECPKCLEN
jgi:hypothetical protein